MDFPPSRRWRSGSTSTTGSSGRSVERDEFRELLEGFEELVSVARMHSAILESLTQKGEEASVVLDAYRGFFGPVGAALHNGMLLETAKALDRDTRAASLPNILAAAKANPEFAPDVDIAAMEAWLDERAAFIDGLHTLRNKRLAHFDVPAELPGGLTYGGLTDLLKDLHGHWITLSRAFTGDAAIQDQRATKAGQDAGALLYALTGHRRERLRRAGEARRALEQ